MRLWLVIIYFGLSACTSQKNSGVTRHFSETPEDESRYVVFKTKKLFDLKEVKKAHLSKTDTNQVKLLIKKAVEEYNSGDNKFQAIQPLNKYKMQFVLFLNSKNEKEVLINSFCDDLSRMGIKWRKQIINVYDGGSCFFNLKINLALNTSYDLYIN